MRACCSPCEHGAWDTADLRGKGDTGRKTGGERGDGTRDGRAKRRDGRVKRRDGRAKRRGRAKHQKNEAQTKKIDANLPKSMP